MSRYAAFNITEDTYKTVSSGPIKASVLIPKSISAGTKSPVIIRWHGGFLCTGSRLYEDWFHPWVLAYATRRNAVIVTADYRLLPESRGVELLEDVFDFLAWLPGALKSLTVPFQVEPNLSDSLVIGESAGGYLAVQTALLLHRRIQGSPINVRAVISQFGVLDPDHESFNDGKERYRLGTPQFPPDTIDKHFSEVKAGRRTVAPVAIEAPDRFPLVLSILQQGRYAEFLGAEDELRPHKNLAELAKSSPKQFLPPIWLYHGNVDSMVPADNSQVFHDAVKKLFPDTPIKLTIIDGAEHGVGSEDGTLETDWIKEGIMFIEQFY